MASNLNRPRLRRSCLYAGTVMHARRSPRVHRFRHGLFLVHLDLDELDELDRNLRLFSRNRSNLYEFRDSDHLPPPAGQTSAGGVRSALVAWLGAEGVAVPDDARISLLTLPRVLGYVFNPVSFYFVHTADGTPLTAVAEVGNTFGEMKPYVVPPDPAGGGFRRVVPKEFYVSPFSDLDLRFDFRLQPPGESLELAVDDLAADGSEVLISRLEGRRLPLDDATLLRLTGRYPLVTIRVITLIHWHALRLWSRRLPWHRKADRPEAQRGVLHPRRVRPPTVPAPTISQ